MGVFVDPLEFCSHLPHCLVLSTHTIHSLLLASDCLHPFINIIDFITVLAFKYLYPNLKSPQINKPRQYIHVPAFIMRCSLLPAMVIGFSALVQATFSSPKAGDSWVKGQENTISWDSKSVSGLVDISCVPAGAKDTTVIIAQIATQIDSSSGSRKWTPDKSISAQSVTIIIVDSKKSYTVSETLILIDVESSSSNKGSGKGGNDYNSGKNNGNDYNSGKNNGNDYNSGKNNGNDYNSGKNNGNDYNSGKGKNATETKSSESEKTKSYEPMVTHSMKVRLPKPFLLRLLSFKSLTITE